MTKTVGQSVPPSLANALAKVARVSSTREGGQRIISPALDLHAPEPGYQGNATAIILQQAAAWLTLKHAGAMSKAARSSFYASRLAEMRAQVFPAEFWFSTAPVFQYADYGVPQYVDAYGGEIDQQFYDPLRRPSYCRIKRSSKSYVLPVGNGTESEPGPGWKGAVIDELYRDLYSVRARFWLPMPGNQTKDTLRPSLLRLNATLNAEATRRGNRSWFYVNYSTAMHQYKLTGTQTALEWLTNWSPWNVRAIQLPPTNPLGWSHSNAQTLLLDSMSHSTISTPSICGWLEFSCWSAPAMGLYFAGNDAIELHGDYTAQLYTPRTSTE